MDTGFLFHLKAFFIVVLLVGFGLVSLKFILRSANKWFRWSAFTMGILALLFGAGGWVLVLQAEKWTGTSRVNQSVPDVEFKLVENDMPQNLTTFSGKVVLLNFWATWCPPCREEMPHLERLHQNYKDKGLVVLTISDEDRQTVKSYLDYNQLTMTSGYLDASDPADLPELFRNTIGRPTTFIIGKDGLVKNVIIGAKDYEGFENIIRQHL